MNVIRMWIVIAILLYSIPYIQTRNLVPFCFIVILATMFHYSALIFFIMYPMTKMKITIGKISLIFLISTLIAIMSTPIFTFITNKIGLYENYITPIRFNTTENIAVKLSLAVSICFLALATFTHIWVKKYDISKLNNQGVLSIEYISYIAMILTVSINIIGLSNNIMGRIIHYFSIFLLIVIPYSLKNIKSLKYRFFVKLIIMVLMFTKYSVVMTLRPEWYQVTPYEFFF